MTWQEKREVRFKKWLDAPGVKFINKAAEKDYRERVTRFIKVIRLEEPDRVPVMLPAGYFPAIYAGWSLKEVMYDYDKLRDAWLKYVRDFHPDNGGGPGLVYPGRVLEMIGHKLHKWPGHGLPDDGAMYQFVESEYMKPEEYDDFMENPTDYWMRVFLPRTATGLEGFQYLPSYNPILTNPLGYVLAVSRPEVLKSFETLLDGAREIAKWSQSVREVGQRVLEEGYPSFGGGMAGAPFDNLTDVLRGTRGIIMDMYRRPEKVIEAMERIVPIAVKGAVRAADESLSPVISMPLHKGDNSFMSQVQFEKFYWPTFKKVLLGLVNEGLVPMPFAEGNYEPRLETIADMPRSSIVWYFEKMDMVKAKKVLGNTACLCGNLPTSILVTSSPAEVKEACRKLIEICAPGGGYILNASSSWHKGNPDNLRAMMEAAREYGTYR